MGLRSASSSSFSIAAISFHSSFSLSISLFARDLAFWSRLRSRSRSRLRSRSRSRLSRRRSRSRSRPRLSRLRRGDLLFLSLPSLQDHRLLERTTSYFLSFSFSLASSFFSAASELEDEEEDDEEARAGSGAVFALPINTLPSVVLGTRRSLSRLFQVQPSGADPLINAATVSSGNFAQSVTSRCCTFHDCAYCARRSAFFLSSSSSVSSLCLFLNSRFTHPGPKKSSGGP